MRCSCWARSKAVRQFDEAAEHLWQGDSNRSALARALTSYGNVLLEQKCHDDAIRSVWARRSGSSPAIERIDLSRAWLAESGRNEAALKDFDRALEIDPQSVFALHNRANVLIALNRHKEARSSIETLLKLGAGLRPCPFQLRDFLDQREETPRSLAVLDRALGIEVDNSGIAKRAAVTHFWL